jgi:methionine biosynthesis protein MetW
MADKKVRLDYKIIAGVVEQGATVLDLGCGDGELLKYLVDEKRAKVQGIEIDENAIYKCVEKGLSVFHSNIDSGLSDYPDRSFDYIVLNQSLQQVKRVDYLMDEAFRVGNKVIVGFPNFANLEARLMLFFGGRVPVTKSLPYKWHDTPNLRFLSIMDFVDFCRDKNYRILESHFLSKGCAVRFLPNLFAKDAIFVISRGNI